MKKTSIILIAFSFLLLSSGAAFAQSFHWDVSTVGATATGTPSANGGNAVNVPDDFTTTGGSTINQTFTGGADDTVLDNGDTFTDFGGLNIVSTGQFPGEFPFILDTAGTPTNLYVYYTGLSGSISNFVDGGIASTAANGAAGLAEDTFDLTFDAGVGDINFYIDDDLTPNGSFGEIEVAALELVQGAGTAPEFVINQSEGQLEIIGVFTDVLDGFWNTGLFGDPGQDFDDITLPVIAASFNLGATFQNATDALNGGIDIEVVNEGSFAVNVVPEPATMMLFGIGLLGIAGVTRRKSA
nr:PEP-CTERM sorting domain-containing protein [uncultured Desulfobacter sp.]